MPPVEWDLQRFIIFCLPFILLVLCAVAWLFMRKTVRSRLRVGKQLRDDPDINDWMIAFNWSRKVLYLPTVAASFAAAIAMLFIEEGSAGAQIVGGAWIAVFFVNFLIDEYEISVKVLMILLLCAAVLFLWLHFMRWMMDFFEFFKHLGLTMNPIGYLLIGLIFSAAVFIAWLRGLFYYVAITPNYLNVQIGPTETGEQISREEYSTRIDTGDFLERLQGFGRIIITFSDQRRQPIIMLVGRIGRKARKLETIRGKLAFDRHPARAETSPGAIL